MIKEVKQLWKIEKKMDIFKMQKFKKQLLRFTTAGSVDDGKSTLIGRLLYDSKAIFSDQLDAIEKSSRKKGFDYVDLSLLTDGLKSEREQGITIDVAYRYFETKKRKFIIADTPGHIQYTRNMVTGASSSNLAVILVDARKGLVEQTHRHSFIASLLGIPHLIVCINKMDLVEHKKSAYDRIVDEFKSFSSKLMIKDVRFIPVSALHGDNIVKKSNNMDWYMGSTLLHELENIHISSDFNQIDARFPIQYVIRPQRTKFQDFRGYCGKIESGIFRVGDKIKILPSGFKSTIKQISVGDKNLSEAFNPMSISMTINDDLDISKGDMIVKENNIPEVSQEIDAIITWLSEIPLQLGKKIIIKHTTNESVAKIQSIFYEIDINTLHRIEDAKTLIMNSIGRVKIRSAKSLFYDSYTQNRSTGSFIIIDPITNNTVGAGIIK